MDKRGRRKGNVLRISVVLISILLGLFAEGSWAQPYVVSMTPVDGATNVLINTPITIQFSETVDTVSISVEDRGFDQGVPVTVQWTTTTFPNDTLIFTPQNGLKPANNYTYEGSGQSVNGGTWFKASFFTKFSTADATPPTVQTVTPYSGKTGVSTGERIYIKFSELMKPDTINGSNITVSGPGSNDYSVTYSIEDADVEIKKNTAFSAWSTYTVTITTNVRDLRGNPLKNQYQWSFTTGAADLINPTVTQTIPATNDTNVSLSPQLHVVFSEEIDGTTFNPVNVTLYDNTASAGVPVNVYWSWGDHGTFGPQSPLTYGHQYTATIGIGVKDRAVNGLSPAYSWSFTTAANSEIDSDPAINSGLSWDDQLGRRQINGSTEVGLIVGAWDQGTDSLTVTAATTGHTWSLGGSGGNYSYESGGNEDLSPGTHLITFTIADGAPSTPNTVTFQRNIFIFSAQPTLSSPANGAIGVSTTPTFQWSYSGLDRPFVHTAAVYDGPDLATARMVWVGYRVDSGSGPQSLSIPADKQLAPNTTYYWGVMGANYEENGETLSSEFRSFTTGGAPPPSPQILWAYVRTDDIYDPPAVQGSLLVKTRGPSPADIVELKVTGPGGYQYIFTEDDLVVSEELGQYYVVNFPNTLSDGTYTFSLTDSVGRTVSTTRDFALVSLPRVDYGTMTPGDNTYVNSTTPTLSWDSVGPGYYYRVSIWDWNANQRPVFMSKLTQNTSVTVPAGYLFPNTSYNWRVDVYDADASQDNRSRSNSLRFSTGTSSYVSGDMIQWVNFYSENHYYNGPGAVISAGVLGPLPNEVTSFNVTGPGLNYDFLESNVMYNLNWTNGNMYTYWQQGALSGGNYTFSIQTSLPGSDSYMKNLTPSTIPIVDQATMSPTNNTYLTTLTPTLTWGTVAGGPWYYRVMIQDWKLRNVIYTSARSTEVSTTIPAGILKAGRSYKFRVEVFDNANGTAANNRSVSAWNCFTTPRRWMLSFGGNEYNDIAVYRVGTGAWFINPSSGAPAIGVGFGGDPFDYPVAGDYDGDGRNDYAVYRHNTGAWWIYPSEAGVSGIYGVGFGGDIYDVPIPFDYDGDGKSDLAIYRISTGAWFIYPSSTGPGGIYGVGFGGDTSDIPVPGDYDGDGKADIAIYRKSTGAWFIYPSSTGSGGIYGVGFGGDASDVPVPGDYDGDGKADLAIYRASAGAWWIYPSFAGASFIYGVGFGGDATDKPVPGDYDGDGKTDITIYRAGTGSWFVYPSRGGSPWGVLFGGDASDLPVCLTPATYMM